MYSRKTRPRIRIRPQPVDRLIETAGLAALLLIIILTFVYYRDMPSQIPVHFSFSGEPDQMGGKPTIWRIPVISLILYVALTLINRFPHIFNYPVRITEENTFRLYRLATRTLRILKTMLMCLFLYITISVIWIGLGKSEKFNAPGILGFIILTILLFGIMISKMVRNK